MKKLNQKGFVLAETLIVTVFLMVLFGMIYSNFLPLIGEYEKREFYDDIDGKYGIFWVKRMIESSEYNLETNKIDGQGFIRFQCDFLNADSRITCKNIVKSLQINNCDDNGNNCDIFITKYRIFDEASASSFKNIVKSSSSFSSGFKNYVYYLPNYLKDSSNGAKYRVFAIFHNTKDGNNYYSYSTIEVNR